MAVDPNRAWTGSMPEAYEHGLGPAVFRPFAVDVAARAARLRPGRVLEVAAGTGLVTRELLAAVPDATVTATDMNVAMVEWGAREVPGARWQVADAMTLPYDDEEFDLVVCQFGVMFFPDRSAAYAEARRVLAPGGRLLFNTWDTLDTHGYAGAVVAALAAQFPDDPPSFLETVPHGYADLHVVLADLDAGGLEVEAVETVTRQGRAESAAGVAAGFCTGTPLRMQIEARADLAATVAAVEAYVAARWGAGPVTAPMTAHVVQARRNGDAPPG